MSIFYFVELMWMVYILSFPLLSELSCCTAVIPFTSDRQANDVGCDGPLRSLYGSSCPQIMRHFTIFILIYCIENELDINYSTCPYYLGNPHFKTFS